MRFLGSGAHTGLAVPLWLLHTAAFVLLLIGVATMQSRCGAAGANQLQSMGPVGYLAPVSCNKFFSFDWFIVFFHFFVWLLVAAFLFSRTVHIARAMLTSLLAIAAVLLMFMTNTWYRAFSAGGGGDFLTSSFRNRARVAFAGALIGAVANLALLMILGLHDEKKVAQHEEKAPYCPPGTVPATTVPVAGTTTAPVGTNTTRETTVTNV